MNKAQSIMDERGDRKETKKDPNVLYSCLRAFIEEQPRQKAARKIKASLDRRLIALEMPKKSCQVGGLHLPAKKTASQNLWPRINSDELFN